MKRDNCYFVVYRRTVFPSYLNEKLRDSTDFDRFNDIINVAVLFFAFSIYLFSYKGEKEEHVLQENQ